MVSTFFVPFARGLLRQRSAGNRDLRGLRARTRDSIAKNVLEAKQPINPA
jgi:hypothetical protein